MDRKAALKITLKTLCEETNEGWVCPEPYDDFFSRSVCCTSYRSPIHFHENATLRCSDGTLISVPAELYVLAQEYTQSIPNDVHIIVGFRHSCALAILVAYMLAGLRAEAQRVTVVNLRRTQFISTIFKSQMQKTVDIVEFLGGPENYKNKLFSRLPYSIALAFTRKKIQKRIQKENSSPHTHPGAAVA